MSDVYKRQVHAGIQLDMDRETGYALFLSCLDERIEQTERVNLRLQVVIEHKMCIRDRESTVFLREILCCYLDGCREVTSLTHSKNQTRCV